ncbi:MAG: hypothetical protein JWM11_6215 [Planctomycetaceae bacterium]|nr:hypothetical protein [Planctomycetaceae bacterium]
MNDKCGPTPVVLTKRLTLQLACHKITTNCPKSGPNSRFDYATQDFKFPGSDFIEVIALLNQRRGECLGTNTCRRSPGVAIIPGSSVSRRGPEGYPALGSTPSRNPESDSIAFRQMCETLLPDPGSRRNSNSLWSAGRPSTIGLGSGQADCQQTARCAAVTINVVSFPLCGCYSVLRDETVDRAGDAHSPSTLD